MKASDALSEMAMEKAAICANLLRQEFRPRYGDGSGRAMMGERARGLEAWVVAYLGDQCGPQVEPEEGDKAWANHWWRRLLLVIRNEEMAMAHCLLAPVEVESQGSVEGMAPTQAMAPTKPTQVEASGDGAYRETKVDYEDAWREAEEEEFRQATHLHREWEARQLRDYKQSLKDEEKADEWRLREYEAMVAQDWDDWGMASAMNSPVHARKRQRVRAVLQVHDRHEAVIDRAEVHGDLHDLSSVPITVGLQLSRLLAETEEGDTKGRVLSGPTSSFDGAPVQLVMPLKPVKGVENSGASADAAPFNLVEFLSSAECQRAFHFWKAGVLTSQRVVKDYGEAVLDAFQTQRIAAEQL